MSGIQGELSFSLIFSGHVWFSFYSFSTNFIKKKGFDCRQYLIIRLMIDWRSGIFCFSVCFRSDSFSGDSQISLNQLCNKDIECYKSNHWLLLETRLFLLCDCNSQISYTPPFGVVENDVAVDDESVECVVSGLFLKA